MVEIGVVHCLVKEREQPLALGRQAQVHDLHASLDGPLEAGQERHALAAQVGAQDAHRDDVDLGRQADDDAGARGAMAEQVDRLVRHDLRLVIDDFDGDAFNQPSGKTRVAALDAAVEDGDGHAGPGRAAPRPLAVDARYARQPGQLGPRVLHEGLRPRGQLLVGHIAGGQTLRRPREACAAITSRMSATRRNSRSESPRSWATRSTTDQNGTSSLRSRPAVAPATRASSCSSAISSSSCERTVRSNRLVSRWTRAARIAAAAWRAKTAISSMSRSENVGELRLS